MKTGLFDYATAFSRNIGWLTPQEQESLRSKRVAIAGLGGVGGSHLLTLTRLGIPHLPSPISIPLTLLISIARPGPPCPLSVTGKPRY